MDRALPIHANVKKMCNRFKQSMAMVDRDGGTPKRNLKRQKAANKEHYKWVLPCFHVKEDEMPCKITGKLKALAVWTTCKLCKFKSPGCRVYGVKTKAINCLSWSRCVKHVENIHYLLDPKDLEEVLANLKAHWHNLEETKARKHGLETRYQAQSTLDECVEEFGHTSARTKRCMANLARLCFVENLPLHMGTHIGFVNFMRQWKPRGPSISKQSMTRSVEEQSRALRVDIKCKTPQIAAIMDIVL